ncbi:MAG TPA: chemotaxis protein CheW [Candidatus Sulfotelmatobacter sp.]|nr:chemotaxis protein CheW [Candidatus Sulfotelmatobacter sp.]
MTTAMKEAVEQEQYLTFLLAGEEYAIGILKVKEIIEYDTVTTVPKTPRWVRGVINLRGAVVPVVDLGLKFGLEDRPVTKTTCIVIVEGQLEGQSTLMGVMVDAVSQVMDIAASAVQEVPTFGTRIKVDYLQGMAQLGKKFVLLLDIDKVLSADEVQDLTAVTTTPSEGEDNVGSPNLEEAAATSDEDSSAPDANEGVPQ